MEERINARENVSFTMSAAVQLQGQLLQEVVDFRNSKGVPLPRIADDGDRELEHQVLQVKELLDQDEACTVYEGLLQHALDHLSYVVPMNQQVYVCRPETVELQLLAMLQQYKLEELQFHTIGLLEVNDLLNYIRAVAKLLQKKVVVISTLVANHNLFRCKVDSKNHVMARVAIGSEMELLAPKQRFEEGEALLAIRPEHIYFAQDGMEGRIVEKTVEETVVRYIIVLRSNQKIEVTQKIENYDRGWYVNSLVHLLFRTEHVKIYGLPSGCENIFIQ